VRLFIDDIERDLGPRPDGWTLDRTDNESGYYPGNVRWADRKTQRANQRTVRALTGERDALMTQIRALTAQLQAVTERIEAPRKGKPVAVTQDALF